MHNGQKMRAWFNLEGLQIDTPEDKEGITKATNHIRSLMEKEITGGIPANRIFLGGFGQGGALALNTGLTHTEKIAGIFGLSCWLPFYESFPMVRIWLIFKNHFRSTCKGLVKHRLHWWLALVTSLRNFETNMFRFGTASSIVVRSLVTWSAFDCQWNVIAIFLFLEWLIYGITQCPPSTTCRSFFFTCIVIHTNWKLWFKFIFFDTLKEDYCIVRKVTAALQVIRFFNILTSGWKFTTM